MNAAFLCIDNITDIFKLFLDQGLQNTMMMMMMMMKVKVMTMLATTAMSLKSDIQ